MSFNDFNLHPSVFEGLEAMGFEKATPIQQQAIPIITQQKDIIAFAQTGTGKTAAFLLPLLHNLLTHKKNKGTIRAVVLVPTRELAIQIEQQLQGFSYFCGISSIAVYGGGDGDTWNVQKNALVEGVDVVVATPGRLIAHMKMDYVKLSTVEYVVLDEADRMLDMGFYNDIMSIVNETPKTRQTLMFSATMPQKIKAVASAILNHPEEVSISLSKPPENILQGAYVVYDDQKIPLLASLLKDKREIASIIFASTKVKVDDIANQLKRQKLAVQGLHSDMEQSEREEVMAAYRSRKFNILVATNIVSRGIDIDNIGLIVNFDVPRDVEEYVHRIGRTARAESSGVAITLIGKGEQGYFKQIEDFLGSEVHKIPVLPNFGETPVYAPKPLSERGAKNFGPRNSRNNKNGGGNKNSGGNTNRNSKPRNDKPRGDRPRNEKH